MSSSDTETNSINPESNETVKTFPTYPHFLYPSKQIPLALASHKPATSEYYLHTINIPPSSSNTNNHYDSLNDDIISTGTNFTHAFNRNSNNTYTMHNNYNKNKHQPPAAPIPPPSSSTTNNNYESSNYNLDENNNANFKNNLNNNNLNTNNNYYYLENNGNEKVLNRDDYNADVAKIGEKNMRHKTFIF